MHGNDKYQTQDSAYLQEKGGTIFLKLGDRCKGFHCVILYIKKKLHFRI